jgi:hypothetical protein
LVGAKAAITGRTGWSGGWAWESWQALYAALPWLRKLQADMILLLILVYLNGENSFLWFDRQAFYPLHATK